MTKTKRRLAARRRVRHMMRVAYSIRRSLHVIESAAAEGFIGQYLLDYGAEQARERWVPGSRRLGQTVAAHRREQVAF